MSSKKNPLKIVLFLLKVFYRFYGLTLSVYCLGHPFITGSILAFFHQNIFVLSIHNEAHALKNQLFKAIVSSHGDGELVVWAVKSKKVSVIRGDSLHQARSSLRSAYLCLQQKKNVYVAVDGPVGPAKVIKKGALQMAKKTAAPLQIIFVHYCSAYVFKKAWDKFKLPKPFSKIFVYVSNKHTYNKKQNINENLKAFYTFVNKEEKKFKTVLAKRGIL